MDWKNLIKAEDVITLYDNWKKQQPVNGTPDEMDLLPVVKLFNPIGIGTWLVTEADEDGFAFGLADLGHPELGYFDLQEIADLRLCGGLVRMEQDIHFQADKPISEYAEEARILGHIKA